ncbi:solute carrier organic anion transporter family member 4A1-like [Amblyomma americanum]
MALRDVKPLRELAFHPGLGPQVYSDCCCIATVREKDVLSVQAELTRRQTTCKALAPFSMGLFLALFETFLNSAPGMSGTIRTVGEPTKPVALGLQWVSVRLFGTILAPIVLCSIIHRSCLT